MRRRPLEQLQRLQDVGLVRLDHLPARRAEHLVEHVVRRLEVEHDVELADVAEVAVERLDERVDELERREAVFSPALVVAVLAAASLASSSDIVAHAAFVDSHEEEERGLAAVDDADAAVVDEGALEFLVE